MTISLSITLCNLAQTAGSSSCRVLKMMAYPVATAGAYRMLLGTQYRIVQTLEVDLRLRFDRCGVGIPQTELGHAPVPAPTPPSPDNSVRHMLLRDQLLTPKVQSTHLPAAQRPRAGTSWTPVTGPRPDNDFSRPLSPSCSIKPAIWLHTPPSFPPASPDYTFTVPTIFPRASTSHFAP